MVIVLDTSAAIEIVLGRKYAQKLGRQVAEADWVIAPKLYVTEVTNVFWKYHQIQSMPLAQCEDAMAEVLALPDDYFDEGEMYKEVFTLGCLTSKPVYDMFFLVLARRNNGYLMSMDNTLLKIARKHSIRVVQM